MESVEEPETGRAQHGLVRICVRPYGNPVPLAFFCFGIGTLLLAAISLHWVSGGQIRTAGILLAAFVFPLEFLTCVIALLAQDTATAATLGLFSTSWLALGLLDAFFPSAATSSAEGVFLIGYSAMIGAVAAATLAAKPLLGLMIAAAALRSLLAGGYELGGPNALDTAAGIDALLIFIGAAYLGLATLLEDSHQGAVLPPP